ncbi:MAG: ATP-binding protein [Acidobacteriota bacterium]
MALRFKMAFGVGAILLVVIAVYSLITYRINGLYRVDAARREADVIANVAERSIAEAMGQGRTKEVQTILAHMGESPQIETIRVLDASWVIRRSSRPEEVGHGLPSGERPAGEATGGLAWSGGGSRVGVFRPVLNVRACQGCHPPDRAVLGMLNVLVNVPRAEANWDGYLTWVALSAVVGLVLTGALITAYFSLAMGRRIETISRTMNLVEAGDLSVRIDARENDEIGQLARSFNAMVTRLYDARRQLEDRHEEEIRRAENLASLGKMAAGIAHQINNPLAGMQNCVRTLLKGLKDEGQRVQYLTMLQDGLGRIGRTVGQLLNFAREAKPQLAQTNVAALLRRVLTLLDHELTPRRISYSLAADPRLPDAFIDPHQMEQVFLNVLRNAMEAMPDGGSLTVSVGPHERDSGPVVQVQVSDTGVGIRPEHQARIFDPFFTTKEVGKGTGLGLSVGYGFVRAHGGTIDVRSEVGKGSTFIITLPLNPERTAG